MAYYRVYSLDRNDRHITDVDHFNADNDIAAMAMIKTDPSGAGRELWTLGRKVKAFARRTHVEIYPLADLKRMMGPEDAFTLVTDVMNVSECPDTGTEHVIFKY